MTVKLRPANLMDCDILFNWVNMKDSISNKLLTNKKIIKINHEKWFKLSLKNENRLIWIILKNNITSGQIRFDIDKKKKLCFVDIYIDQNNRKQDIGKTALKLAIKHVETNESIEYLVAYVLTKNKSSINFFKSLGFNYYECKGDYIDFRLKLENLHG